MLRKQGRIWCCQSRSSAYSIHIWLATNIRFLGSMDNENDQSIFSFFLWVLELGSLLLSTDDSTRDEWYWSVVLCKILIFLCEKLLNFPCTWSIDFILFYSFIHIVTTCISSHIVDVNNFASSLLKISD